jgi:hypothetical protein
MSRLHSSHRLDSSPIFFLDGLDGAFGFERVLRLIFKSRSGRFYSRPERLSKIKKQYPSKSEDQF